MYGGYEYQLGGLSQTLHKMAPTQTMSRGRALRLNLEKQYASTPTMPARVGTRQPAELVDTARQ